MHIHLGFYYLKKILTASPFQEEVALHKGSRDIYFHVMLEIYIVGSSSNFDFSMS